MTASGNARRNILGTAVERVADKFGGFADFARALGLVPSTVRHWNKRGGGVIPGRYRERVVAAARKERVKVAKKDLG